MKVLLHTDVDRLGYVGDVVDVADGYARNYLLPQRLAVEPTETNVQAVAEEKAKQAELRHLARQELERAADAVKDVQVTIAGRANEQGHLFGSVGEADVASALQEKGFVVQSKQVLLAEHLRQLGTFPVKLRFANDLEVSVEVSVVRPEDEGGESESAESESESAPGSAPPDLDS